MPSRRKSAHTTKIERVPRYEVYHGEEDLDDRLHSEAPLEQGLDLSMKRIKVEPMDYGDRGEDLRLPSKSEAGKQLEMEECTSSAHTGEAVVVTEGDTEKQIASSGDGITRSEESESIADDANASTGSDHMTAQHDTETQSPLAECASSEATSTNVTAGIAANGSPLFAQSSQSSKGKQVRPFKLYTANRDLLSGLSTQGGPTLATYSVPIALTSVTGAVPLAFASVPLVNGAPMIPVTASSTTTSAASSGDAMGAGADASSSTTSSTGSATAKTTSTTRDAHLMTLATEADKILRERHGSESSSGSTQESLEGRTAESVCSSGGSEITITEDGGVTGVLKIPSIGHGTASNGDSSNSLSFIQKRAVAAAVAATNPSKTKKKRQSLPEDLKDVAYWERRRKNNEAAKRSRDARRAKEDQIAIRAALLEQENIRLKIEVAALKEETAKLRAKLYSNNNS